MAKQGYVGHTTTILPDGNVCIWSPQPHAVIFSQDQDDYAEQMEAMFDTLMEVALDKKYIYIDWLEYFKDESQQEN